MSEAYWVGGGYLAATDGTGPDGLLAQAALESALQACGVRANWLDQVHWLVEEKLAVSDLPALENSRAAQFAWREQPQFGHHTLHAVVRALMTRESDLLALGALDQNGCAVSLLAAPRAVGRYNLIPQMLLCARLALPAAAASGDWWAAVEQALENPEDDSAPAEEQMTLMDTRGALALGGLPDSVIQVSEVSPGGLCGRVNGLAAALVESSADHALLVDLSPGALLASLLERV